MKRLLFFHFTSSLRRNFYKTSTKFAMCWDNHPLISLAIVFLSLFAYAHTLRNRPPDKVRVKTSASTYSWIEPFSQRSGYGSDYYRNGKGIADMGVAGTYGEILPEAIRAILEDSRVPEINENDVVYDLGSGTGKIVAQFAFETACKQSKGIELGLRRHKQSVECLDQLKANKNFAAAAKIEYIHGDITNYPWHEDVTILYVATVCFPPALMVEINERIVKRCRNLRCILHVAEASGTFGPTGDGDVFPFTSFELPCPASWSPDVMCTVHIRDNKQQLTP